MKNSNLPYVVRIGIASCIGNDKAVEQAIQECLTCVSKRVVDDVARKYARDDLELENLIVEHTKCITVDEAELLRQAREEND